jgi:hypothetical protein
MVLSGFEKPDFGDIALSDLRIKLAERIAIENWAPLVDHDQDRSSHLDQNQNYFPVALSAMAVGCEALM